MRSSERSAASAWRAIEAAWARQRRTSTGSLAARPAERRESPAWASMATICTAKPGLEGIAGMQCFDGVHRVLVAFRRCVRGVGDGRGKLAAQASEDFASAGGGGVGEGGVEGHGGSAGSCGETRGDGC